MSQFEAGSYIDNERKVRLENGDPDPQGRWIDEAGYVRLENGDSENGSYVDEQGYLYDGNGVRQDESLRVPEDWSVASIPTAVTGLQRVGPDDTLWTTASGEEVKLSTTTGTSPSTGEMEQFSQNIRKTPAKDAMGGDLAWAAQDEQALREAPLHGRALNTGFAGEDTGKARFPDGTLRQEKAGNDQWTTAYGVSDGTTTHKSVAQAKATGGLLTDSSGQTLNGEFGYVVGNDGTLYTFNPAEIWVTLNGKWVSIADYPGTLAEAVDKGESVTAVHHSSPVSGQPVVGAGKLKVTAGVITEISNDSGHYKPEAEYLWQTMQWLAAQGMDPSAIKIRVIATERNAEQILANWKLSQGHGNVGQIQAKDEVTREIDRRGKIARLVPGSLQEQHYRETGGKCLALEVKGDRYSIYCTCDADVDLPAKYQPLLNKGPAEY